MMAVAFLAENAVVDRIIRQLELTFEAEEPLPSRIFEHAALMADFSQHSRRRVIGSMSAAEKSGECEKKRPGEGSSRFGSIAPS